MRIDLQTLPACCQNATAAEAAVVEEMQSAGEKLRSAREDKREARADKLHEMRQITKKLREIASATRSMGFTRLGLSIGSCVAEIGTGMANEARKSAIDKATANVTSEAVGQAAIKKVNASLTARVAKYGGVATRALDSLSKNEALLGANVKTLEAEKSAHDTAQERAAGREEMAGDAVAEAKRLADASLQRLEAMQRVEHEGQLAILRG